MSTTGPVPKRSTVRQLSPEEDARYDGDVDSGWALFAGSMLGILATMNFIYGIAAVSTSKFLVGDAKFVLGNLHTWGWVLIVIAVAQAATAFGVFAGWPFVRWVGVAFAGVNAIAQLIALPAYPFWSVALFALDVLVIYALVAHGERRD
jgi:hypothetical protein